MSDNGIEVGVAGHRIKVTGRDFLIIAILGLALGYIVWDIHSQRQNILEGVAELRNAIITNCFQGGK